MSFMGKSYEGKGAGKVYGEKVDDEFWS